MQRYPEKYYIGNMASNWVGKVGGWKNHFVVEVEILILYVGFTLKVEITFEELRYMMV